MSHQSEAVLEDNLIKQLVTLNYEKVLVDEGSSIVKVTPAVYRTETEKIQTQAARTEWKKGKADAGCLSADPEDCKVWCLVDNSTFRINI